LRALVVYESMFGNTREVAQAIAAGIATLMPVETVEVGEAPAVMPDDVGLLVVGGPTHAHGLTTPDTRADAGRRAGDRLVSRGNGIREWLASVRTAGAAPPSAAFDTRIKGPKVLWGSAAKGAAGALSAGGFRLARPPECFLVDGPTGPPYDRLVPGEAQRARTWGSDLATVVVGQASSRNATAR
jgi:hypothetical protein